MEGYNQKGTWVKGVVRYKRYWNTIVRRKGSKSTFLTLVTCIKRKCMKRKGHVSNEDWILKGLVFHAKFTILFIQVMYCMKHRWKFSSGTLKSSFSFPNNHGPTIWIVYHNCKHRGHLADNIKTGERVGSQSNNFFYTWKRPFYLIC